MTFDIQNRIWVGKLKRKIKEQDLIDYFSKYGKITDIYYRFRARGFAYITFQDQQTVEEILKTQSHGINGCSVIVRKLEQTDVTLSTKNFEENTRLHLSGFDQNYDKKDLYYYFKEVGKIKDITIPNTFNENFSNFAFIEFEDLEVAKKALDYARNNKFLNKNIVAQYSKELLQNKEKRKRPPNKKMKLVRQAGKLKVVYEDIKANSKPPKKKKKKKLVTEKEANNTLQPGLSTNKTDP